MFTSRLEAGDHIGEHIEKCNFLVSVQMMGEEKEGGGEEREVSTLMDQTRDSDKLIFVFNPLCGFKIRKHKYIKRTTL